MTEISLRNTLKKIDFYGIELTYCNFWKMEHSSKNVICLFMNLKIFFPFQKGHKSKLCYCALVNSNQSPVKSGAETNADSVPTKKGGPDKDRWNWAGFF